MIIRVVRHDKNFTVIENAALQDRALSFKATGLLAYLLSMPDNWTPNRDDLAQRKTDGVASVRAGMTELKDAGYITVRKEKLQNGTFVTVAEVYERPVVRAKIAPPLADYPPAENPPGGNQPVISNEEQLPTNKNDLEAESEGLEIRPVGFFDPGGEHWRDIRGRLPKASARLL